MNIDFDEWFDNLKITPNYIIKTNLDVFDKKQPVQPSQLFQLLKKPSKLKTKKHIKKLLDSINASFVLYNSNQTLVRN